MDVPGWISALPLEAWRVGMGDLFEIYSPRGLVAVFSDAAEAVFAVSADPVTLRLMAVDAEALSLVTDGQGYNRKLHPTALLDIIDAAGAAVPGERRLVRDGGRLVVLRGDAPVCESAHEDVAEYLVKCRPEMVISLAEKLLGGLR